MNCLNQFKIQIGDFKTEIIFEKYEMTFRANSHMFDEMDAHHKNWNFD